LRSPRARKFNNQKILRFRIKLLFIPQAALVGRPEFPIVYALSGPIPCTLGWRKTGS
jgi:hypothetical protein